MKPLCMHSDYTCVLLGVHYHFFSRRYCKSSKLGAFIVNVTGFILQKFSLHSKLCFAKQYLFNIRKKVYYLCLFAYMKLFGQDRELGLCPEINKHVTNPPLLQMDILKSLPGINFSNSTMIHIFDITEHCEKCLYTGQHKGTFLMDILF